MFFCLVVWENNSMGIKNHSNPIRLLGISNIFWVCQRQVEPVASSTNNSDIAMYSIQFYKPYISAWCFHTDFRWSPQNSSDSLKPAAIGLDRRGAQDGNMIPLLSSWCFYLLGNALTISRCCIAGSAWWFCMFTSWFGSVRRMFAPQTAIWVGKWWALDQWYPILRPAKPFEEKNPGSLRRFLKSFFDRKWPPP